MENKLFVITEEEKMAVEKRTAELAQTVVSMEGREGYYAYAKASGFTEEEAKTLIDEVVFPTVDEYNTSCREAFEGDTKTWIQNKMTQNIEAQGMDTQEAAKYKLGVLQAVRKLNAGGVQEDADVLTDDEKAMLEAAEFTDEMISRIDEALIESIDNSAMPLYATEAFNKFLEGKDDEDVVHAATWELWQDEQLKYCTAAAMCIARRNSELPSIPTEVSDAILALGACQGVDVANIEAKVSVGEMTVDFAYNVLKAICAVALVISAALILVGAVSIAVGLAFELAVAAFGASILASVAGIVFSICLCPAFNDLAELMGKGINLVLKGADMTYGALKRGAKALYHYTVEHVVPAVKTGLALVKDFLCTMAAAARQYIQRKNQAHARA